MTKDSLCQKMQEIFYNLPIRNSTDTDCSIASDAITRVTERKKILKNVKFKEKTVNKPWITPELLSYIKEGHRLYKKYLKLPLSFRVQYRELRNRVSIIVNRETEYCNNKFTYLSGNTEGI